jgi:integrase/recombinase XerD
MAVQLLHGVQPSPLDRLINDYLSNCAARGLSPRTDEQYSYALRSKFLVWCDAEGIARLEELDARTFDRYTTYLLSRRNRYGNPVSKHAVHSLIRPVRLMLNWAKREGEPVQARPQLPRREKPNRDVLTREEVDLLEQGLIYERDKVIVRVFADCGLRLDELTKLKATDVVRSGREAHLRVLGKRGRIRDVPVAPSLLRRLDRLIESRPRDRDSDGVFIGHRRRDGVYTALTQIGVYRSVKDAFHRSGIKKPVYPHILRHSWMTEMLRCGMNPIQLSIIAGASVEVINAHYTHLNKSDAYEAMIRALSSPRR